jgi:uncharacterized repeat protein (TIGR01451 family)
MYVNQLGFDADLIDAPGVLANGATSATVQLSTTLDQYLTQMVSLATDLSTPRLTVVKRVADVTSGLADGSVAAPGDVLRYTITVTNTGDDEARDVSVADSVPPGTVLAPGSAAPPLAIGTLAPGASASASFDVRVADGVADGTSIVNTASASGTGATAGKPVSATSEAVTTRVVVPAAAPRTGGPGAAPPARTPPVSVRTTVTPRAPRAGEAIVVRTVVENTTAAPIDDVVVTVRVPGASVRSARIAGGRACSTHGGVATCPVGRLQAGESAVVRMRVRPRRAGGVVRPVVTVRGDGIAAEHLTARAVRVAAPPALRVTKRALVQLARPGQAIGWTIVVRSVGGSAARGIRVCDRPGAGLELTGAAGPCWRVRSLAPGRARSFRAFTRVTRSGAGRVVNTARATATNVAGAGRAARALQHARAGVTVVPVPPKPCGVAVASASRAGAGGLGALAPALAGAPALGAGGPEASVAC